MGWSQVYKILILWGFTEKSNFYGGEKKKGGAWTVGRFADSLLRGPGVDSLMHTVN